MKYCEKCGNKLEEGFTFCDKCGAKVEGKKEVKKEEKEEVVSRPPVRPMPLRPPKKKRGLTIFLSVLSILLLAATITFMVLWLVKSSSCNSSSGGGKKGKDRTVEYLLDQYVKGYTKPDLEAFKNAFPSFYTEYIGLTQDVLNSHYEDSIETYGKDFNIKYKINGKAKMTKSELEELNDKIASRFKTKEKADECYKLSGTITFTGSLYEDTDPIDSASYCKFNGTWYLI